VRYLPAETPSSSSAEDYLVAVERAWVKMHTTIQWKAWGSPGSASCRQAIVLPQSDPAYPPAWELHKEAEPDRDAVVEARQRAPPPGADRGGYGCSQAAQPAWLRVPLPPDLPLEATADASAAAARASRGGHRPPASATQICEGVEQEVWDWAPTMPRGIAPGPHSAQRKTEALRPVKIYEDEYGNSQEVIDAPEIRARFGAEAGPPDPTGTVKRDDPFGPPDPDDDMFDVVQQAEEDMAQFDRRLQDDFGVVW